MSTVTADAPNWYDLKEELKKHKDDLNRAFAKSGRPWDPNFDETKVEFYEGNTSGERMAKAAAARNRINEIRDLQNDALFDLIEKGEERTDVDRELLLKAMVADSGRSTVHYPGPGIIYDEKSYNEILTKSTNGLIEGYKAGQRGTATLQFDTYSDFSKAVILGGTMARYPSQQVTVPAFPMITLSNITPRMVIESDHLVYYDLTRGDAAVNRAENAQIGTGPADTTPPGEPSNAQISRKLESIAAIAYVPRESLQDVPQLRGAVERVVSMELADRLDKQLYTGTASSNQLQGLLTTGTIPAGTGTGFANTNRYAVPQTRVATTAPNQVFETIRPKLINAWARGAPWTHIFGDPDLAMKFVESLDNRRYNQYNRDMYPFGELQGTAFIPTANITLNSAVGGPFPTRSVIATKGEMELMMSDDFAFDRNAIAIRATIRAAYALYQSGEFFIYTTTNYFAASPTL